MVEREDLNRRRVLRNTVALYLQFGGSLILALLQIKILTSFLLRKEVGTFYGGAAFGLTLAGIAQLGFPMVFARYFPKYEAEDNPHRIKGLFLIASLCYWVIALIELPLALLAQHFIQVVPLKEVLLLAFATYILYGYLVLLETAFTGLRKMHLTAFFTLSSLALFNLFLYILRDRLTVRLSFLTLLYVTIPFILIALLVLKPFPFETRGILKEIRTYGTYSFLTSLLAPFFLYLDRFLVALFLPLGDAALFQVARRIEQSVRRAFSVPLEVLAPEFSFIWEKKGGIKEGGDKGFKLFAKLYLLALMLAFLLLVLLGKPFILLISTREYLPSYPYLVFLLLGTGVASLYVPYMLLARSSGRMKLYFLGDLVFVFTYLVGALILVKPFGIWGFILAWLSGYIAAFAFTFGIVQKVVAPKAIPWKWAGLIVLAGITSGILGARVNPLLALLGMAVVGILGLRILTQGAT